MVWSKNRMNYLDLKQALDPSDSKMFEPCDFQCDSCEREPSEPKGPQKLDPCVLQFANCDRLEARDAVYIFNEVGCGKTISAGLMALHYLFNNEDGNVLVITDNALVKHDADDSEGQFMKDWRVLPFEKLGLKESG